MIGDIHIAKSQDGRLPSITSRRSPFLRDVLPSIRCPSPAMLIATKVVPATKHEAMLPAIKHESMLPAVKHEAMLPAVKPESVCPPIKQSILPQIRTPKRKQTAKDIRCMFNAKPLHTVNTLPDINKK